MAPRAARATARRARAIGGAAGAVVILLAFRAPAAPLQALDQGITGDSTIAIEVDGDGSVTGATVLRPGGPGFDEAAVAAARRMRFSVGAIDGCHLATRVEYTFDFPLNGAFSAGEWVTVRGWVREAGTGLPLDGAEVTVTPLEASGAGVAGAAPVTQTETTAADGHVDLRSNGHRTVVRGRPRSGATVYSLDTEALADVPGSFGDPVRAAQALPGIGRTPYGVGGLSIRGAAPQDSRTFIDGHPVPLSFHLFAGPFIVNPGFLDRLDYLPGAFSVEYGGVVGGVIDLVTRTPSADRTKAVVELSALDGSAFVSLPVVTGLSVTLAGRRSTLDLWLPHLLEDSRSSQPVLTPSYADYQGRVDADLQRAGRAYLMFIGSSDHLTAVSDDVIKGNLDLRYGLSFQGLFGQWSVTRGRWTSTLSPTLSEQQTTLAAGGLSFAQRVKTVAVREELSRRIGDRGRVRLGYDGELDVASLDFTVAPAPQGRETGIGTPQLTTFAGDDRGSAHAVYLAVDGPVASSVRVAAGVRAEAFGVSGRDLPAVDPRVDVTWNDPTRRAWTLSAGLFHSPPTLLEVDPHLGNPNLGLAAADQYQLAVDQRFGERSSVHLAGFFARRRHLVVQTSADAPSADDGSTRYADDGAGRSFGLDLFLRWAVGHHFSGWISYTLSRNTVTGTPAVAPSLLATLPVGVTPPPMNVPGWHVSPFDQTHALALVGGYQRGAWYAGARFRLVSGFPVTPVVGSYFNGDTGQYVPMFGAPSSSRLPFFNALDLRVERTWHSPRWQFSAFVDVMNVYDAVNPEGVVYDYRFGTAAFVRGLPVIPTIGVRGQL